MNYSFAERSPAAVFVIAALLVVSIGVAGIAGVGAAEPADATVSEGESIQDAINAADPGETIEVEPGTYEENIEVDKELTLVSTGDTSETTIIGSDDDTLLVTADQPVVVDGFTFETEGASSVVALVEGEVTLRDSHIDAGFDASNGVFVSTTTIIEGAEVRASNDDGAGIQIQDTSDVSVTDTLVESNDLWGIRVERSESVSITDSDIVRNFDDGLLLEDTHSVSVSRSTIEENEDGVGIRVTDGETYDLSTISFAENNIVANDFGMFAAEDQGTFENEVDAATNWWGSADGPNSEEANGVAGAIDFEPFLEEEVVPTEIDVTAQNPEPATTGEMATYEATFTYEQTGVERTEFISVDVGTDTGDISDVTPDDVTITEPDSPDIGVASVDPNDDQLVIELDDGDAIDQIDDVETDDSYDIEIENIENGDAATHTLTIGLHESGDTGTPAEAFATASDSYTVDAPAEFDVTIDETNSPVGVGDTLEVRATVTNVGDETGSDTVTLALDGQEVDDESIDDLAGDASEQVTLTYETTEEDLGEANAVVEIDDSSDSQTVSVIEDALEFAELQSTDFAGSIYATPEIYDGTIYVGNGERISAVDADTADNVWTVRADGAVATTPAVHDGTVIVGSDDGTVYALDADTGDQQWAFDTDGAVESSPAIHDGTVYIGSQDGFLYALDADDGTEEWAYDTESAILSSSPVVDDGSVYVGDADGTVHAVDTASGDEEWTADTGDAIVVAPAVVGDTVYVADIAGNVAGFEVSDGQEEWTETASDSVYGEIAADTDAVYIGTLDGSVIALAAEDGTEKWDTTLPSADLLGPQLTLDDGTVFAGTDDGAVLALASETGDTLWQTSTPKVIVPAPAVEGDQLIVGDSSGNLSIYEASGEALFDVTIESTNSPVTAGETLEVDVDVENVGEQDGEETIELELGGEVVADETVSLNAGASKTITLTYETTEDDVDVEAVTVSGATAVATTPVSIGPAEEPTPAEFDVTIESTNSPVTEGDTLEVDVDVENVGEQDGEETIELDLGGEVVAEETVELDAGGSETITLTYETTGADVGTQTATVSGALRTDSVSVAVESDSSGTSPSPSPSPAPSPDPASFDILTVESNAPIGVDETLTVSATIENTGEQDDEQDVSLLVDGEVVDSQTTALDAGETADVTLSTTFDDAGEYDLVVETEDDSTTFSGTVTGAADETEDDEAEQEDDTEDDETEDDETEQDADETEDDETEEDTDDTDTGAPADDDQPGFGVLVTLVGVVAVLVIGQRRT